MAAFATEPALQPHETLATPGRRGHRTWRLFSALTVEEVEQYRAPGTGGRGRKCDRNSSSESTLRPQAGSREGHRTLFDVFYVASYRVQVPPTPFSSVGAISEKW